NCSQYAGQPAEETRTELIVSPRVMRIAHTEGCACPQRPSRPPWRRRSNKPDRIRTGLSGYRRPPAVRTRPGGRTGKGDVAPKDKGSLRAASPFATAFPTLPERACCVAAAPAWATARRLTGRPLVLPAALPVARSASLAALPAPRRSPWLARPEAQSA